MAESVVERSGIFMRNSMLFGLQPDFDCFNFKGVQIKLDLMVPLFSISLPLSSIRFGFVGGEDWWRSF